MVKQNQHQEVLNTCTEHTTTKVFNTEVPIPEDTEVFNIRSAKSAWQSEALEHFNMENIFLIFSSDETNETFVT